MLAGGQWGGLPTPSPPARYDAGVKRVFVIGGLLLSGVVLAAILVVWTSLDFALRTAIETYGSQILQVDVRLESARISLAEGSVELRGLFVGNPSGFKTPQALEFERVRVKLDTASINADPIVIEEIVIEGPHVTYEPGLRGGNLAALLRNVSGMAQAEEAAAQEAAAQAADGAAGAGPKLVIAALHLTDGHVHVADPRMGEHVELKLPDLHLEDIGRKSGGASPAQVVQLVLGALVKSTGRASAGALGSTGQKLGESLKGALQKLVD